MRFYNGIQEVNENSCLTHYNVDLQQYELRLWVGSVKSRVVTVTPKPVQSFLSTWEYHIFSASILDYKRTLIMTCLFVCNTELALAYFVCEWLLKKLNVICLCLQFDFNKTWYHVAICVSIRLIQYLFNHSGMLKNVLKHFKIVKCFLPYCRL